MTGESPLSLQEFYRMLLYIGSSIRALLGMGEVWYLSSVFRRGRTCKAPSPNPLYVAQQLRVCFLNVLFYFTAQLIHDTVLFCEGLYVPYIEYSSNTCTTYYNNLVNFAHDVKGICRNWNKTDLVDILRTRTVRIVFSRNYDLGKS